MDLIKLDDIIVCPDRRQLRPAVVDMLVQSIDAIGLLYPVILREDRRLVAGEHRIAAYRRLGREMIEFKTIDEAHAEIAEIDENCARAELTSLQRGEEMARRKVLYEDLHPDAPSGPGRPRKGETVSSFSADTAAKTGASPRTIQHDVQIGEMRPTVRDAVRGSLVEDNKRELLELARIDNPETQLAVAKEIQRGAITVGAARKAVDAASTPPPDESSVPSEADDAAQDDANDGTDPGLLSQQPGYNPDAWSTPSDVIEDARTVLGAIDVDPATNPTAQGRVKAKTFYTETDNGLGYEWHGRVWLNPPYSRGRIDRFTAKLIAEYDAGRVTAAIILVNNSTDAAWFRALSRFPMCFSVGRVPFIYETGQRFQTRQGQAFFYLGPNVARFREVFGQRAWFPNEGLDVGLRAAAVQGAA